MMKRTFILAHEQARQRAAQFCTAAPEGWVVTVSEPTRNLDQNAKFHAIVSDIAKSGLKWGGKPRTAAQWKVLLVSGHAAATNEGSEMVPGLEGEFVNLRESTALMSKKRSASLIEYALAFAAMHEVRLSAEARTALEPA
ncbi:recombination protein NinB [Massilia sp. METH4]|uniref:recombination protein NinB n=1 Tax=Massilia sp. METH4 TaxID=3123041 RepID=UPI0030CDF2EE